MESHRFDALIRAFATFPSRRALLPLVGSVLAAPLLGAVSGVAKKKKKKKKTTLCLDGQTILASKKKKKKLLKSGATPGACASSPPPPPPCTPACGGKPCGADDGCGVACGCAAGSVCDGGACQPCTVACTGNGAACGEDLQEAIDNAIGTVYACPGRYVGSVTITNDLNLVGAGHGDDPATSTILDGNDSGRVVDVAAGNTVVLQALRLTRGRESSSGGGIRNRGTLTVKACTVTANHIFVENGGGISNEAFLTLDNSIVSGNSANSDGGGIYNRKPIAGPPPATLTINASALTGNTANRGGGLYNAGKTTFDSASSVTGNTASNTGGGIYNENEVLLNGANVSGNTPDNCVGVTC